MASRPNILWIVMDSQRPHNIGAYGDPRGVTPVLDQLAAEGAVFERNITSAPWCLPSHASMMTGHYASTHGADGRHERLSEEYPTIGEELTELGYATVGISNNAYMSASSALHRGFMDWSYVLPPLGKPDDDKGGAQVVRQMLSWLRGHEEDERPFFMFVNINDTHTAYIAPEPWHSRWAPDVSREEARELNRAQGGFADPSRMDGMPDDVRDKLYALMDGEAAYVDDLIGRVVSYLRDAGTLDDTMVVVTSDHGDVIEEHPPYWNHQLTVFEAVAHVPLIVRYPTAFEAGTRVSALTQTHDVVATVYDLIGADRQLEWLGESSHSLLRARDGDARSYALCEFAFPVNMLERVTRQGRAFELRRFFRAQRAYYRDEWKYIWTSDGRDMLYNLADDPTEQVNLFESENDRAREYYLELEAVLGRIPINDYGDWMVTEYMKGTPKESWEKIRRWGYLRPGQADKPAFRN